MLQHIHFIDKSFDYINVEKYQLSLQVFLKGFSFSVLDREKNKFVALGHYTFSRVLSYRTLVKLVDETIANEPLLQCNFSHVKLMFATANYTFVPSAFYSEDTKNVFYCFNQDLQAGEELLANYIFGNASNVIFSIPAVVTSFFKSKYPTVKIYHQSVPFIEELTLKSKLDTPDKRVFINVFSSMFDFVFVENGEVLLYNTFNYKSINDFNYFFLNAIDNLKLSPLTTQLYLCGNVTSDSEIIESLKEYIKNINYFVMPTHFEYAYGFNDVPAHFFTNMINLYQCG